MESGTYEVVGVNGAGGTTLCGDRGRLLLPGPSHMGGEAGCFR